MRREGLSLGRARRLAGTRQAGARFTDCVCVRPNGHASGSSPLAQTAQTCRPRAWADSAHVGRSWPDDVTSQ